MEKQEKLDAYLTAHAMIEKAKKWVEHSDKQKNKELIVIPGKNVDGSLIHAFQPPHPRSYEIALKEQIANMDDATKDMVFSEIAKVSQRARAEMNETKDFGTSSPLEEIIRACDGLYTFKSSVEKTEDELSK